MMGTKVPRFVLSCQLPRPVSVAPRAVRARAASWAEDRDGRRADEGKWALGTRAQGRLGQMGGCLTDRGEMRHVGETTGARPAGLANLGCVTIGGSRMR